MRAVVQRVTQAQVDVDGETVGKIGPGLLVLLAVSDTDTQAQADYLADKLVHLRIFNDEQGRMNRSCLDIRGQVLVVSQFTLLGDCRKGRRPSFVRAAPPDRAKSLYEYFIAQLRAKEITVASGRFQTRMAVSLVNEGPVTLIVDSKP
ncbi:MAG: D-tyrosyl-tRNA(Tyr) deacylase [Deltaproteobacteria bacterium]|nr:D-tyrosyl-tRNA(Tyr) deacylase [Deltaproteobacteria bacterium]